jgi:hypothetical protein
MGKPKKLQSYQAYWQLYNEKLKSVVDAKYKDYVDNTPQDEQQARIAFTTKLIRELFDAESGKVKKQVKVYREKQAASGIVKLDDESDGEPVQEDAQQSMNEQMQK